MNHQISDELECVDAEQPPRSRQGASYEGSKVTRERVALLVVCALLAAAVVVIYRLALANLRGNNDLQTLREGNEVLRFNCSDWALHGGKCYYFSIDYLSWDQGRGVCRDKGGDLVKIDSREEQSFLVYHSRKKQCIHEDKFWIGLTDSEEEGRWVWVDGSPLDPSLSFWSGTEPDNWTKEDPDGEDCARMGYAARMEDLKAWFDRSCQIPHRYICEKQAERGRDVCP